MDSLGEDQGEETKEEETKEEEQEKESESVHQPEGQAQANTGITQEMGNLDMMAQPEIGGSEDPKGEEKE